MNAISLTDFRPGQTISVRVLKADGSPHRQWRALVESVGEDCIVTVAPAGNPVRQFEKSSAWREYAQDRDIRSYYWPNRQHTLLEIYDRDGSLFELYADICSPIQLDNDELRYIDHELDVLQMTGEAPQIVDQDEFEAAAVRYGYSEEFQRECYQVAKAMLRLIAGWTPRGTPSRWH